VAGAVDVFVGFAGTKATTASSAAFGFSFGAGFARDLAVVLGALCRVVSAIVESKERSPDTPSTPHLSSSL
jgi:hypothetical protein